MIFDWANERFIARADRALFWPTSETLIVADPHFGKDAAFRAVGIPVPHTCTDATAARLSRALHDTGARRLIILGDFLHARLSRTEALWNSLRQWRAAHPALEILLVRGNHDRAAGDPLADLDIRCVPEGHVDGPFVYCHTPCDSLQPDSKCASAGRVALYGHVHPAADLHDRLGRLRLPCFFMRPQLAVLPAFGAFTGLHPIRPARGDRVFVIADDTVIDVSPNGTRASA